jgi:RNA polymerase sigma-70 factor (ECF subfamily)
MTCVDSSLQRHPSGLPDFRALYEREFTFVWNHLRRFGVRPSNLPDVAHDVFFVVFRSLAKYDPTLPFRPWLFGILFRVARDHLRLSRNIYEIPCDEFLQRDRGQLPDERAVENEQWSIVDRALVRLDLRFRAVVVMYDFAGLSAREIADALGIPIKTVFSRLRIGRARLVMGARELTGRPTAA